MQRLAPGSAFSSAPNSSALTSSATLFGAPLVQPVTVKVIPYFPLEGNIEDLNPFNGSLALLRQNVAAIRKSIEVNKKKRGENIGDERFTKQELETAYSIIERTVQINTADKATTQVVSHLFALYQPLGHGNYGRARLAYHLPERTNPLPATWAVYKIQPVIPNCKKPSPQEIQDKYRQIVQDEMEASTKLNLAIGGIGKRRSAVKKAASHYAERDESQWNLMLQLAEGCTLENFLINFTHIRDLYLVQIALKLTEAVEKLHTNPTHPLLHLDLKPSNIIVKFAGNLKDIQVSLIDFGLAFPNTPNGTCSEKARGNYLHANRDIKEIYKHNALIKLNKLVPPERGKFIIYSPKMDIHALGVIFAELIQLFNPPRALPNLLDFHANADTQDSYIVDVADPKYLNNTCISDKAALLQFYLLIKNMTSNEDEFIPDLAIIKTVLSQIQKNILISLATPKIKVLILAAKDFFAVESDPIKSPALFSALSQAQLIKIIDKIDRGDFAYMLLRHNILKKAFTNVDQKAYIHANISLAREMILTELAHEITQNAFEVLDLEKLMAAYKPPAKLSRSIAGFFNEADLAAVKTAPAATSVQEMKGVAAIEIAPGAKPLEKSGSRSGSNMFFFHYELAAETVPDSPEANLSNTDPDIVPETSKSYQSSSMSSH